MSGLHRIQPAEEQGLTGEAMVRQLSALYELIRSGKLHAEEYVTVLQHVTEVVAQAVGVERVSVWCKKADGSALRCLDLYELSLHRHSSGQELLLGEYPRYATALASEEVIVAEDAHRDERMRELSAAYLTPHGVTSLIDIPIHLAGGLDGVFRYERCGAARHWMPEEITFTIAAANVACLVIGQREHQRAEVQLQESQRRYQELVNSFTGIVWEADGADLRFTFISRQVTRLLGYDPEDLLQGLTWKGLIHPDDLSYVSATFEKAVEEKRSQDIEYRILAADGRGVWVRDTVMPIIEGGRLVQLCGVMMVITERKDLEAQLHQAQKMEAVGKLAGGIAHDFNNLLTIITGYTQLLLNRLGQEDPLVPDIQEIKKAGDRAAALTQQLLAFSRRQVLIPKVVDLNSIVANMETMLQRLIGEDIHLVTALDPALGRVKADPGQLEQVIMNLVVNARDAMPKGGKLTIETTNHDISQSYRRGQAVIQPGRYAMLSVSDTGCGMEPELQARVFEPFFSTKGQGKGTGLGLSTVYGIVKQSDGYIFVYSEPGCGSTFKIHLPRVDEAAVEVETGVLADGLPHGTETVLLVEDEPGVRALVRDTLRMQGYTVLEARHGIEALLVSKQHTGPIHLLMTDVVMPQMSGREVADRLFVTRSDLRVLFMSGYTENAIVHHGVLHPGTAFLQKPFSPESLARKVREVLDAGKAPQEPS